jgi:hypothetical protein
MRGRSRMRYNEVCVERERKKVESGGLPGFHEGLRIWAFCKRAIWIGDDWPDRAEEIDNRTRALSILVVDLAKQLAIEYGFNKYLSSKKHTNHQHPVSLVDFRRWLAATWLLPPIHPSTTWPLPPSSSI